MLFALYSFNVFSQIQFPKDFLFGLATAPGHAEDQLDDIWLDFATQKNGVYAYKNHSVPEKRLEFWSDYQTEIDSAAHTGIGIYRLGIDWGRLTANSISSECLKNKNCNQTLDPEVVLHYQKIINYIKSKKLKIMLTLFHHSLPKWAMQKGGFTSSYIQELFVDFAKQSFIIFQKDINYWITINEPSVYAMLTHAVGLWPSSFEAPSEYLGFLNLGFYQGRVSKVLENLSLAHKEIYKFMHLKNKNVQVSIAKNIAYYTFDNILYYPIAKFANFNMNYSFLDEVIDYIDFIGVNYYGAEYVNGLTVKIKEGIEYSEAGRAVDPNGFYKVVLDLNKRYNHTRKLPFFITENGIADSTDYLRPSYLIEHLKVIEKLIKSGIEIKGYIFWTLTDNWEWADGYCPKFGLVSIDRKNNLQRIPRDSYSLFSKIVTSKMITPIQEKNAWSLVQAHSGENRPFCRDQDGKTPLNSPIPRKIQNFDWRFSL